MLISNVLGLSYSVLQALFGGQGVQGGFWRGSHNYYPRVPIPSSEAADARHYQSQETGRDAPQVILRATGCRQSNYLPRHPSTLGLMSSMSHQYLN